MKEHVERALSATAYFGAIGLTALGAMKYMETSAYQHSTISSPLYYAMGTVAYLGSAVFPTIAGAIAEKNEENSVGFYDSPIQSFGRKILYGVLGGASALSWVTTFAMIRG